MSVRVGDVVAAIDSRFPESWAESWDNVGLLVGDADAEVAGVLVTLDPTLEALESARSVGATMLATHHPATLTGHERLLATGPSRVLFRAAEYGIALVCAHTNLDRAPGAGAALAGAIGLTPSEGLERSAMPVDVIVTFVPSQASPTVRAAMAAAGAGHIGDYTECSFTGPGVGRFTPGAGAQPHIGSGGDPAQTDEERIEMVAPAGRGGIVAAAAAAAHPYEEPLVLVAPGQVPRGAAVMGCVCAVGPLATLGAIAAQAAGALSCTPRVWGDADTPVARVACATGSAASLIGDAIAADAQVMIAGEVRYHDALAARESGLAIIEVGHDVSEWPLVPLLAGAVETTAGLGHEDVHVDRPGRGWWTP